MQVNINLEQKSATKICAGHLDMYIYFLIHVALVILTSLHLAGQQMGVRTFKGLAQAGGDGADREQPQGNCSYVAPAICRLWVPHRGTEMVEGTEQR